VAHPTRSAGTMTSLDEVRKVISTAIQTPREKRTGDAEDNKRSLATVVLEAYHPSAGRVYQPPVLRQRR